MDYELKTNNNVTISSCFDRVVFDSPFNAMTALFMVGTLLGRARVATPEFEYSFTCLSPTLCLTSGSIKECCQPTTHFGTISFDL